MDNIKVIHHTVIKNAINARDLHKHLESKKDYTSWIKSRISKYEFQENEDYLLTQIGEQVPHQGGFRSRATTEYFITLDMAKELSMIENTEKGREARRYFIAQEKRAKQLERELIEAQRRELDLAQQLLDSTQTRLNYWEYSSFGDITLHDDELD